MRIDDLRNEIINMKDWLVSIRRDLHMYPELGLEENRTSTMIKKYLDDMNIEYETYEGQTSVVGIIRGRFPGKTIAIRADMDALPILEKNDVVYKSKNHGVMHACGHDAHTTILLGAGKILSSIKQELHGNIKLLFQPAEETVGGADRMVKAGCMENPKVDYVIGLHVMPNHPCGIIETKYGPLNGASDGISIAIKGRQAHGAYPDLGVDAIAIAGQVITALQNIVSRNVSPLDSAVLTLGTIKGGVKGNVIADEVHITGTLRTISPNTRIRVKERIKAIVKNVAESFGGEGKVEIEEGYAALINSEEVVEEIINTIKENFGEEALVIKEMPSLGVEDFSYFIDAAKGAFYHLGCGNAEKNITAPLHNECFDIDEDCLPLGVLTHTLIALRLLEKK
ncbi:amidohydrolase [Clostridium punense]|uniref:Amidohydrolase n=1 Tax=Clostridium punense TaxID=1054297 RepID=A0ABS4K150_9CLOT|nr:MULTISPECIES: amidohydrolase [Clostridium]EQB87020.1 hypothetical protein M918_11080 [Clostridium sp. BL8]MBP2020991.1 amidohydrolase [Clostridium punense]